MGDGEQARINAAEVRSGRIVDKQGLASYTGYSVSWIEKLMRQGMPIYSPGRKRSGVPVKFDTAQVLVWMIAQEREKTTAKYEEIVRVLKARAGMVDDDGNPTGSADELMTELDAKRRERAAKAQIAEIELRVKREQVVDIASVTSILDKIITVCRARILAIPSKCADMVATVDDPKAAYEIMEQEVYDALSGLSHIEPADIIHQERAVEVGSADDTDGE